MGRIFISAGHFLRDPGASTASGTTEAQEMILTRDLIVNELVSRGVQFFSVPDTLDLKETIHWINERCVSGDVAIEIHGNAATGSAKGTEAFFVDGNVARQKDAEKLLEALIKRVPGLINRGAKPDTITRHGRLAFCRDVNIPSVLIELGFLDNHKDLALLQNHRDWFAKGLADGLIEWSKQTASTPIHEFPIVNIKVNDLPVDYKGIYMNNNSLIPVDLVERLKLRLTPNMRTVSQGGIVYIKAIDLQEFNISLGFDNATKTLLIKTNFRDFLGQIDRIMGEGKTSEEQLTHFLKINHEKALDEFSELPDLYIQQAKLEGVNHDIAFCQMCLETGFLQFGGSVKSHQNNFCGLGAIDASVQGASFPDSKTGVKAHIQHLKAYASKEEITHPPIVDPRFDLVERGSAPLVGDLSRRWAAEAQYGDKIIALIKRLYRSAGLL